MLSRRVSRMAGLLRIFHGVIGRPLAAVVVVGVLTSIAIAEPPAAPDGLSAGEREALFERRQHRMAEALRLRKQGKLAEAVAAAEQVLALERRLFGDADPALTDTLFWVAQTQLRLAQTHSDQHDPAETEAIYRQVLKRLDRLGRRYYLLGDYVRAEPVLRQALEISRGIFGQEDPDSIACLNNLAQLYHARADYAQAEPLLREALQTSREVSGPSHPDYAVALNNLAGLYRSMGDYARAEPLLRRSLEIRKRVLGPKHPDYATSLNSLAVLYHQRGEYARAEPLYLQALEIRKEALGRLHRDYATTLNNLGALYESMGERTRAEPLYREALEIRKQVLGEAHPDYAASLNFLAAMYRALGDYDQAEPLYRQALETRKRALGTRHPDYAASLNNLAVLYRSKGDYARAEPLYGEALEIQHRLLKETFDVLSERQQLAMTRSLRRTLDGYLSVTSVTDQDDGRSYQYVLAWKGMVFVRQRRTRLASARPELAPLVAELQSTAARLAALVFSRPDPSQHEAWQKQLAELSENKERIEAELARRGAEFGTAHEELTAEQLRALLPAHTALVDFLEYTYSLPARESVPAPEAAEDQVDSAQSMPPHLVAFVVRRDHPVRRLDLGPAAPVHRAIEAWRRTYGQAGAGAEAAMELRRRLWLPLEKHLAGVKTVLVSPDGNLARVPLAALPGKEAGTYLLEERALAIVAVPQWLPEVLAGPDPARDQQAGAEEPSLLLLGDIDYDASPRSSQEDAASDSATTRRETMHFTRLDSSRGEILAVRDSFELAHEEGRVRLLRRGQATEAAFRREAPRHRFLHLATHGFFAPPEWSPLFGPAQEDGRNRTESDPKPWPGGRLAALHPGLLSGLALAGANAPVRPGADDGILTAEEVAALNLGGVDLAVLSACETGLGPVAGGEGVLGLQRAFQVSGARTVVASLWKVSDQATRQLMERFYENLWDKKMGKLEALRQAQLAILREGPERGMVIVTKAEQAARPKRSPPYYWAAFVLSGDWR